MHFIPHGFLLWLLWLLLLLLLLRCLHVPLAPSHGRRWERLRVPMRVRVPVHRHHALPWVGAVTKQQPWAVEGRATC